MKPIPLCGAVLLPALLAAGCTVTVDSQGQIVHEEKRFTVRGTPSVAAATFDGTIQVQSWDNDDVLVEIEKRGPTRAALDEIEVQTSQNGNQITVEVRRPRHSVHVFGLNVSPTARLTVWVPRHADVRARSGDGSISIERVNGKVDAHTGDGSIRATDIAGDLNLTSGDGSVTVDNAEGRLALDTGDGSVNVSGKLAVVRLHTGDGSIVYRADPGTTMNDDWDITTGDGGVTLYLPSGFGAELDAHTGDGSIRNDLELSAHPDNSSRTVRGRIGAGGRQLRIRTGDGSIRIKGV
jgi:DUF4097 and DUF4098 domain-containing protein YvlB